MTSSVKSITRDLMFLFLTATLTACSPRVVDVTSDRSYWGRFQPGQRYRTKEPTFLVGYCESFSFKLWFWEWDTKLAIAPPGYNPLDMHPKTIEEYIASPDDWHDVVAILQPSTEFKVVRFEMHPYNIGLTSVIAEILNGPYRGKFADIDSLSKYLQQGRGLEPNVEYIEFIP